MKAETKHQVARYYNLKFYGAKITFEVSPLDAEDLETALDVINSLNTNSLVLDGGCGSGRMCLPCARAKVEIVGIDLSKNSIKTAHGRAKISNMPNLAFIIADLEHLPFRSKVFGATLLFGVLEYVHDPRRILLECNRTLREHGKIVFNVWNRIGIIFRVFQPFYRILKSYRTEIQNLLFAFSPHEIRRSVSLAGFKIEKLNGYKLCSAKTYVLLGLPFFKAIGKRLDVCLTILCKNMESSYFGPYICSNLLIVGEKIDDASADCSISR